MFKIKTFKNYSHQILKQDIGDAASQRLARTRHLFGIRSFSTIFVVHEMTALLKRSKTFTLIFLQHITSTSSNHYFLVTSTPHRKNKLGTHRLAPIL